MILVGDCLEVMRTLDANSVDAIVCDPPYHLTTGKKSGTGAASDNPNSPAGRARIGTGFMGKAWDGGDIAQRLETWAEVLRVAKPGAFLVAFGGTRTFHRMACAMEDAGWELRDTLMWVYGSGFPKSLDVSKAIDKAAGEARQIDGRHAAVSRAVGIAGNDGRCLTCGRGRGGQPGNCRCDKSGDPVTDAARQWQGWGTALKPAWEPIILARKPLIGTVAANVLAHGTGALNIDGCRVQGGMDDSPESWAAKGAGGKAGANGFAGQFSQGMKDAYARGDIPLPSGRWPANLIHDGSAEVVAQFPTAKAGVAVRHNSGGNTFGGDNAKPPMDDLGYGDSGSGARFFYCAKADRADRNDGCDGFEERPLLWSSGDQSPGTFQAEGTKRAATNNHPTVKPTDLMRWLCRLVTPPGGLILDPFTGSGSTGRGAILEGFRFIGIELDPNYAAIAEARIAAAVEQRRVETAQLSLFDNVTMKEFADAA